MAYLMISRHLRMGTGDDEWEQLSKPPWCEHEIHLIKVGSSILEGWPPSYTEQEPITESQLALYILRYKIDWRVLETQESWGMYPDGEQEYGC